MTVSEMIKKLKQIEETGKGNLEVLFQDRKEGFGWALSGKYQIGHCDDEGYVWHPIDVADGRILDLKDLSEKPDVVIFG